jgi:ubiquinone/menaquinone biosynthesis C-methylase UbiE
MATQRKQDVERFDHWSSTYERSWMQRVFFDPSHRAVIGLAASVVQQPESVLDVGCGTGRLLRRANASWPDARLIGVDPANGMVETAKHLTPNATFFTGMAEALPLNDASVDLAFSTISFHHWQDQAAGLREIARVLRPGGYFILADISVPDWVARVVHPQHFHGPAQMRALFTQAGFQVQTQRAVAWRRWLATLGKKY